MLNSAAFRGLVAVVAIAVALAWGVLVMQPAEKAFVCENRPDIQVTGTLCFQDTLQPKLVEHRFRQAHGNAAALDGLKKDFVFLALYGGALALAAWAAATGRPALTGLRNLGVGAAIGAALTDVVEDALHIMMVQGEPSAGMVGVASLFTIAKWWLLITAVVVVVTLLVRRFRTAH
jgi:hypothetical protein